MNNADINIDKNITCCFTGHRNIPSIDKETIEKALPIILEKLYTEKGIKNFIAGGAYGFDTLAATQVLDLKKSHPDVRLILALPCENQADKWNKAQKELYTKILNAADEKIYVSKNYTSDCMHKRNRFMVDNSCSIIIYMLSPASGTGYTVRYAIDNGLDLYSAMYV